MRWREREPWRTLPLVALAELTVAALAAAGVGILRALAPRGDLRPPRVRVAEAREGQRVRVGGRVRAVGELLRAPFSGRPCVLFEATLTHGIEGAALSGVGGVAAREFQATVFEVEDETGRALVRVDPPLDLWLEREAMSSEEVSSDAKLQAFLHRTGVGTLLGITAGLEPVERRLEPGDWVVVVGIARWDQDPEGSHAQGSYRESARRLVLLAPEGGLVVCDDTDRE
jgi:hypothetical protein